jgi:hypothetical protein
MEAEVDMKVVARQRVVPARDARAPKAPFSEYDVAHPTMNRARPPITEIPNPTAIKLQGGHAKRGFRGIAPD